jgi:hypothetical protein
MVLATPVVNAPVEYLEDFCKEMEQAITDLGLEGSLRWEIVNPKPNLTCAEVQFVNASDSEKDEQPIFHLTKIRDFAYGLDFNKQPLTADMVRLVKVDNGKMVLLNADPAAVLAILSF